MEKARSPLQSDFRAAISAEAAVSLPRPKPSERLASLTRAHDCVRDCALIAVVTILSMVTYIAGLGFYSDDWMILGDMVPRADTSVLGLLWARAGTFEVMRPFEAAFYAILYPIVHLRPLPYHLLNGFVLVAVGVLTYLTLRELTGNRLLSIAVALIYILMPNYSTTRFWFDVLEVNASVAFCLFSLYAGLRATRVRPSHPYAWLSGSLIAAVASALWYELAMPVLLLIPLFAWLRTTIRDGATFRIRRPTVVQLVLTVLNTSTLVALALFKVTHTPRAVLPGDYLHYLISLAVNTLRMNYGWYGVAVPRVLWTIAHNYFSIENLLVALAVGVLAAVYLYKVSAASSWISRPLAGGALVGGVLVFMLGYAIFLTNHNVGFSPTGANNRTAMVAALGVAASLVGLFAGLSSVLRSHRYRRLVFSLLVAMYAASGSLIVSTIASFWVAAAREQTTILAAIQTRFPVLSPNTSLLVSGACPYIGPGMVSDSPTNLSGALRVLYRDASLRGSVVTPGFQVDDEAIFVVVYGREYRFPLGSVIAYNPTTGETLRIESRTAAEKYLQATQAASRNSCPVAGPEGYGVHIF